MSFDYILFMPSQEAVYALKNKKDYGKSIKLESQSKRKGLRLF
jgi:hypothetical protein